MEYFAAIALFLGVNLLVPYQERLAGETGG
jgi:hypothetical protein